MNESAKKIIESKLENLSKSKFRSSFHLKKREKAYLESKGMEKIREHAYNLIRKNISPANPLHDGAQTPMKNHPVFIAQHATATCCRKCLYRWHKIPLNHELTRNEENFIVELIMAWLTKNKN